MAGIYVASDLSARFAPTSASGFLEAPAFDLYTGYVSPSATGTERSWTPLSNR